MDHARNERRWSASNVVFICAALLAALLIGRVLVPQIWHWASGNHSAADLTGVSDRRFADVVGLRGSDGLFTMPELGDRRQVPTVRVHATYLASRILGARFPAALGRNGRDALAAFAASPESHQQGVTRLEAYAALSAAGDGRAREGVPLADQAAGMFSHVNSSALPEYLAVMEPATLLDPGVRKAQLLPFSPGSNENLQRVAASAMALSYVFSNQSAIGPMFPNLQAQMTQWVRTSRSSLPQFLISAAALQASSSSPLPATVWTAVTQRLHRLLGCRGGTTLLSVTGTRDGVCSLTLTAISEVLPQ